MSLIVTLLFRKCKMLYACNAISLPMEGSFPIRYYPATVVFCGGWSSKSNVSDKILAVKSKEFMKFLPPPLSFRKLKRLRTLYELRWACKYHHLLELSACNPSSRSFLAEVSWAPVLCIPCWIILSCCPGWLWICSSVMTWCASVRSILTSPSSRKCLFASFALLSIWNSECGTARFCLVKI